MTYNHLSIQGAMYLAGNMIKDAFTSFSALEVDLLSAIQPRPIVHPLFLSLFKWSWKGGSSEASYLDTNNDEIKAQTADQRREEDVKRYIQALKDCIVGSVHWVYETELFFGKKGGEVRTFGWVFANTSGEGFE
jgi:malonyl CoA-acyl carrier protein transacylase